jgi:lipoate---protein ligase
MEFFSCSKPDFSSPSELLARDEALLEYCETTSHPGFLTFWESTTYFVVLGYGKSAGQEVLQEECARLNVPVLRRCSGGGTVLQGPGCFNYALILPFDHAAELDSITSANRFIMEKNRAAIATLTDAPVRVAGCTDLALNDLKFAGNAQRRKRRSLLFHGSFLLDFDLTLISKTLRLPHQQPDYRQNRAHESFLTNLKIPSAKIENGLINAWNANTIASSETHQVIATKTGNLALSKYSHPDWTFRS